VSTTRPDQVFHRTKVPGLQYRKPLKGERSYWGYLPGRGRVKLTATTPRAAEDEYRDLRGKVAKGEKIAPANLRFKDVAEEWIEQKNGRLREWTRRGYRASLDNELIPRFGHRKLREISVDDIAKFVRALEAKGLSTSTIENHLKPMSGTFRFAVRRGYISQNPVAQMTVDDRPEKRVRSKAHEWTPRRSPRFSRRRRLWPRSRTHTLTTRPSCVRPSTPASASVSCLGSSGRT